MAKVAAIRAPLRQLGQKTIPSIRFTASRSRGYASSGSNASSSNALLFGGIAAAALGGGYYYSQKGGDGHLESGYSTKVKDAASPKKVDYQAVYNAVADILDAGDEEYGQYKRGQ